MPCNEDYPSLSPFLGPRCLCRDGMNLLQWRGTEPTHKEGILGVSAKKFSLQSLFFGYHNSRLLSPCPLHTVSHRDKRLKISLLGFGLNTLCGGIVSKKHMFIYTWHSLFREQTWYSWRAWVGRRQQTQLNSSISGMKRNLRMGKGRGEKARGRQSRTLEDAGVHPGRWLWRISMEGWPEDF